jgi:hypothetical protein
MAGMRRCQGSSLSQRRSVPKTIQKNAAMIRDTPDEAKPSKINIGLT